MEVLVVSWWQNVKHSTLDGKRWKTDTVLFDSTHYAFMSMHHELWIASVFKDDIRITLYIPTDVTGEFVILLNFWRGI